MTIFFVTVSPTKNFIIFSHATDTPQTHTYKKSFPALPFLDGMGAQGSFLREGGFGRERTSFRKKSSPS
jgi:hypothetical protein